MNQHAFDFDANARQADPWTSHAAAENIINAQTTVTLDTLDRIAAVFGVSGHWMCIPIEDWPRTAA
mgnify:CR=1 FL=1